MSEPHRPDPSDFLPLSPPVYQILLALGDEAMHGYGIIQEFERRTGQTGALLPGSLYNTIGRMLKAGLLVEPEERPTVEDDDERRRYYRSTELGRRVAMAETARLKSLLDLAEARHLLPEEG